MAEEEAANMFDPTMKKKKKKKPSEVTTEEPKDDDDGAPGADAKFDFGKKKKSKKPRKPADAKDDVDSAAAETSTLAEDQKDAVPDYTYTELLDRVYVIMRQKNPTFDTGEKKTFVIQPPSVMRAGSKKTAFANFGEICRTLKRQPKHLLQFLMAELGTSGSVDGNNCLIIKGRYQQKHIEAVLRKYIKEYVTCHTCKSPETILQKDTRLFFLQCETCGSRCSVTAIKTGFQAITVKRARTRAAQGM